MRTSVEAGTEGGGLAPGKEAKREGILRDQESSAVGVAPQGWWRESADLRSVGHFSHTHFRSARWEWRRQVG